MKTTTLVLAILTALFAYSCATDQGYNTQKGAAIGAIGGALAGQAIGHNTGGTLIGAAGGALVGAVVGNAVDQSQQQKLAQQQPPPPPAYTGPPPAQEGPPGQWVDFPGEMVNGQWVPPHKAWVPATPPGEVAGSVPPPPSYAFTGPPDVVPIPGTYAYFVPGIGVDILFYQGYWYRPFGGYWYRAQFYNGPWAFVPGPRVPRVLVSLPPGWRRVPPGYRPIPHAELQRNWQRWERERHWEHR